MSEHPLIFVVFPKMHFFHTPFQAEEYNRQAAEIAAEKEKQEGGIAAHNVES